MARRSSTPAPEPLAIISEREVGLNKDPESLYFISGQREDQKCATFRETKSSDKQNHLPRRVGLEFAEESTHFVSRSSSSGGMHYFHFIEFLIIAASEMEPSDEIAWIFVPKLPEDSICGRLNCLVASFWNNEQDAIPHYGSDLLFLKDPKELLKQVDSVLVINRARCNHAHINKGFADYLYRFPSDVWFSKIKAGIDALGKNPFALTTESKLVVTYIDRQSSWRRLPWPDHNWIVRNIPQIPGVEFRHIRMEQYSGQEQLQIASTTDVFLGVHGNGLTHQMLAKPGGLVIEMYWWFPYQFDYYSMAVVMEHDYVCIYDGQIMEVPDRNQLLTVKSKPKMPSNRGWFGRMSKESKDFMVAAIEKKGKQKERRS